MARAILSFSTPLHLAPLRATPLAIQHYIKILSVYALAVSTETAQRVRYGFQPMLIGRSPLRFTCFRNNNAALLAVAVSTDNNICHDHEQLV